MSSQEKEFIQLKVRYNQAVEYEKTKLMKDTPEGKEWAFEEIKNIMRRMTELWELLTEEEKANHMELFESG